MAPMERICRIILKLTLFISMSLFTHAENIVWLKEPQSQYVTANSSLNIDCFTNASSAVTQVTMWKRNENWFYDFRNKHYRSMPNGSIYFSTFLAADEGLYQCSVYLYANGKLINESSSQTANLKIAKIANTFAIDPQSKNVSLGESITLQCVSPRSEPTVDVSWQKDGQQISGYLNVTKWLSNQFSLSYSMQLVNLSISSAGVYRCLATNPLVPDKVVYSQEANIQFTALMKRPYFITKPVPTVGIRFRKEILSCNILGEPKPSIYWYRNNVQIASNSSSLYIDSVGNLHFNPILINHNGSYYCKGVNSVGSVASFPPVPLFVAFTDYDFELNPTSMISYAGESVLFDCEPPRSYPVLLRVLWYHDYRLIKENDKTNVLSNNSLVISMVTANDVGVYFCSVFNPMTQLARSSRKASLDILVMPIITTAFVNITATIGFSTNITCIANGKPTPIVLWYKSNVLFNSSSVLQIENATSANTGWYSCIARNTAGEARKRFFLHIFATPSISFPPVNQSRIEGKTARFNCETSGKPIPIVSWGFTNVTQTSLMKSIKFDDVKYKQVGHQLWILNVTKNDKGWYHCLINSLTAVLSEKAFLDVYTAPNVIPSASTVHANASDSIALYCNTNGYPDPSITWLRLNDAMYIPIYNTSAKYKIQVSSLVISDLTKSDAGNYICNAINIAGNDSSRINLTVQVPPSRPTIKISSSSLVNTSFAIWCHSSGIPAPDLNFYKDGVLLHPIKHYLHNSTIYFEIPKLSYNDSGNYLCQSANLLGKSIDSVTVFIQGYPDSPTDLQGQPLTSMVVNLTWHIGFDGNSQLLDPLIYFKPKNDNSYWHLYKKSSLISRESAVVEGLMPCTAYMFRVYTQNGIGKSRGYAEKVIKTLSKDLPVIHNISAVSLNASMVQLHWPQPQMTCHDITSYNVTFNAITSTATKSMQYDADSICHTTCYVYIDSLLPFKTYQFFIQAALYDGKGLVWTNQLRPVVITTRPSVPSLSPNITNLRAVSSSEITFNIIEIPLDHHNGILLGYRIRYKLEHMEHNMNITVTDTFVTLKGLLPFSIYGISACGYNSAGDGVYSTVSRVQTLESIPGPVHNLSAMYNDMNQRIVVTWSSPIETNGILKGYIVSFWSSIDVSIVHNITIPVYDALMYVIHNTTYHIDYFIIVSAFNSRGSGDVRKPITIKTGSKPSPTTIKPVKTSQLLVSPSSISITSSKQPTSTTLIDDSHLSWFNKDNFPLILGVLGAIFLIFTLIIICLIVKLCRKKKKAQHWIVKKTEKAADDVSHLQTSFIDVRCPGFSDTLTPQSTDRSSQDKNLIQSDSNDTVWDGSQSPSDNYARLKNSNDSSLIKLRSTLPPELGEFNGIYEYPGDVIKRDKKGSNGGSVSSSDGQGSSGSDRPSPPPRIPIVGENNYDEPRLPKGMNNCAIESGSNSDSEESGIIIWA